MSSNADFSTLGADKQAEIISKLQILFKGNDRFHGAADVKNSKFDEDKNKWRPGNIRCTHTQLTDDDWRAHLMGERFIGVSPLQDDGTVWFTCMDIDKIGEAQSYDFIYEDEMSKIKRSGYPLVVYRTKSGGLRITMFFSEPVEAELAIKRMTEMAATLGYSGCEIFPKQYKVNSTKDFPAWIFLPYGPAKDNMFPDQCCMNELGHPMELYESIIYATRQRITKQQFFDLFVIEIKAKANGKANGKHRPQGIWTEEKDYATTVETTFHNGPVCQWIIARQKCTLYQHNFLFNCAIFLMRKYPDNWEVGLKWINDNVLSPPGDPHKLNELKESIKKKHDDRPYEYTCKNEPICSHCFAKVCKKQRYGVGVGNGMDYYDLAITVYNSSPQIFFTNVGEDRIACSADELMNLNKYRVRCLENSLSFPDNMARKDWDRILKTSLENATQVDPPELLKPHASEIGMLQRFFGMHIPHAVRSLGEEYLNGKGKPDDLVRIRRKEGLIYFKWDGFENFGRRAFYMHKAELQGLRMFISEKGEWHDRKETLGGWYRSTFSLDMNLFNEEIIKRWLSGGELEEDDA